MTRPLSDSTHMIFIPYRLPEGAEDRGYAPWLRKVDNPFFNSIPGVHHYANWRIDRVLRGQGPAWDWFDFKGLTSADDLERVWFSPDLDMFRRKWLELWGYGAGSVTERPAFLRYSYLFRRTHASGTAPGRQAVVSFGTGAPPVTADLVWERVGYLPKHFAADTARDPATPWLLDSVTPDPLGFDWIAVGSTDTGAGDFSVAGVEIAAPDNFEPQEFP